MTTGDRIIGELSVNGEWLAAEISIEGVLGTPELQVIEVATGRIIMQQPGTPGDIAGFGEDDSLYSTSHSINGSDFPDGFSIAAPALSLSEERAAWLGKFDGDSGGAITGIVVADLRTGSAEDYQLPDVILGTVSETGLANWTVSEFVSPTIVWDEARNRILLVHGDDDKVTMIELDSGVISSETWGVSTSWLAHLSAWLIPPAQAKGPSEQGVQKTAVLSQSGDVLYVGRSRAALVTPDEGDWFIENTPLGVEAISTTTWEVIHRWDIPASEVAISPDGKYLVATGATWTDSMASTAVADFDAFVIDTDTHELLGQFRPPSAWSDVQFSPDGRYFYLAACCEYGPIDIVDSEPLQMIGRAWGTLFGKALLLAMRRP